MSIPPPPPPAAPLAPMAPPMAPGAPPAPNVAMAAKSDQGSESKEETLEHKTKYVKQLYNELKFDLSKESKRALKLLLKQVFVKDAESKKWKLPDLRGLEFGVLDIFYPSQKGETMQERKTRIEQDPLASKIKGVFTRLEQIEPKPSWYVPPVVAEERKDPWYHQDWKGLKMTMARSEAETGLTFQMLNLPSSGSLADTVVVFDMDHTLKYGSKEGKTVPRRGVLHILQSLKDRGAQVIICTAREGSSTTKYESIRLDLRNAGLEKFFINAHNKDKKARVEKILLVGDDASKTKATHSICHAEQNILVCGLEKPSAALWYLKNVLRSKPRRMVFVDDYVPNLNRFADELQEVKADEAHHYHSCVQDLAQLRCAWFDPAELEGKDKTVGDKSEDSRGQGDVEREALERFLNRAEPERVRLVRLHTVSELVDKLDKKHLPESAFFFDFDLTMTHAQKKPGQAVAHVSLRGGERMRETLRGIQKAGATVYIVSATSGRESSIETIGHAIEDELDAPATEMFGYEMKAGGFCVVHDEEFRGVKFVRSGNIMLPLYNKGQAAAWALCTRHPEAKHAYFFDDFVENAYSVAGELSSVALASVTSVWLDPYDVENREMLEGVTLSEKEDSRARNAPLSALLEEASDEGVWYSDQRVKERVDHVNAEGAQEWAAKLAEREASEEVAGTESPRPLGTNTCRQCGGWA